MRDVIDKNEWIGNPMNLAPASNAREELENLGAGSGRAGFALLILLLLLPFIAGVPAHKEGQSLGHPGVETSLGPDGQVVLRMDERHAASTTGIQTGDILLAVDGNQVPRWSMPAELLTLLLGPVGSEAVLRVRSADGTTKQVQLTRGADELEALGWSPQRYGLFLTLLDIGLVVGFLIPAVLILLRGSPGLFSGLAAVVLIVFALGNTSEYTALLVGHPEWVILLRVFAGLYTGLTILFVFLFPSGGIFPAWARYGLLAGLIFSSMMLLPYPYHPFAWPRLTGPLLSVGIYGTGFLAQVYRYKRQSDFQAQQQSKWVLVGLIVALVGAFLFGLPQFLVPALQQPTEAYFRYQLIGRPLANLVLLVLPVVTMFSVLRHHLYEVDLIINRALVYIPLSAVIAGVIAASITLSQKLFLEFAGNDTIPATVLASLLVVTIVTPVKERLQSEVDRFFTQIPDPDSNLKRLVSELENRLFQVDASDLGQKFLATSVQAFQANGGSLELHLEGGKRVTHITRNWDGVPCHVVPLRPEAWHEAIGELTLGCRMRIHKYSKRDIQLLAGAANVVARVLVEDNPHQWRSWKKGALPDV